MSSRILLRESFLKGIWKLEHNPVYIDNAENAENAAHRISERLKFKISREGGGHAPGRP